MFYPNELQNLLYTIEYDDYFNPSIDTDKDSNLQL